MKVHALSVAMTFWFVVGSSPAIDAQIRIRRRQSQQSRRFNTLHEQNKMQAEQAHQKGDYPKAIELASRVLRFSPRDDVAFYIRASARVELGIARGDARQLRDGIADAREAIRMAGEMNAESVVIVSGARSGHTLNHARRLLVEGLRELTDLAAEHDLMLAIQPMHSLFSDEWTFVTSIDETLNILSQCDRRYVGMLFDVYHLWQEPRLIERIPEIVPFVTSVQLNDWREPPQPLGSPRSENDRCLLGEGIIPLSEITRAFVEANYHGYFEIEIWSDEVWNADYDQLLHLCRRGFDAFCRH
ncbi:MAG: sugar phosphate isomerase/epimerase [Proteobacteria bacterium]|nr:sugar phosphate isomerase/epimerase [Pseudomonadota bacterium]